MSDQDMIFSRQGEIAQILLNRPENGNMLTLDMVNRLAAEVAEAGRDPGVKAILLAANGDDFLAGLARRSRVALETCKTYLANARLMETDKAADYAGNLLSVVMSSK